MKTWHWWTLAIVAVVAWYIYKNGWPAWTGMGTATQPVGVTGQ